LAVRPASPCKARVSRHRPTDPGDAFTWRAFAEPETFDPALMQEFLSIDLGQNVYDALTEFEPNTQRIQGALAERWEVSPDASVYTFFLRQDAKFSDGTPVTAADVVWSYNRVANTPEAPYEFVMRDIKGFTEVRESVTSTDTTKTKVTTVSGIEAVDDHTVRITLANPSAYFISETTVWTYYVVNRKAVEKGGEWMIGPGAGSGAYIIDEWKHNESMRLTPNPNYWGTPKPTVAVDVRILTDSDTALALLERGELDALDGPDPSALERLKSDATLSPMLHSVGQARTVWVGLNVMRPPFGPRDDPKATMLRQAMFMSIDRQLLVDLALSGAGIPLTTLMPEGEPGYKQYDPYPFDPVKAKQLMADAGYPNGQGLDLTYTYRQRDAEQRVAEQLQAQWKENLGLDVKIVGVEWTTMLAARQAHEYQMFYGSWGHDYPDPQNWLFALFHSSQIQGVGTGSGNDPGWSNPEFDRLVDQANQMADPARVEERYGLYNQAEKILLDEAPLVPLYQAIRYWLVRPEWTGYNTNNSFIFPFKYVKPAQ
jgi:peptide/nickel transport system substrate-binding protein/oligopeptide transport system substrate-binding protein